MALPSARIPNCSEKRKKMTYDQRTFPGAPSRLAGSWCPAGLIRSAIPAVLLFTCCLLHPSAKAASAQNISVGQTVQVGARPQRVVTTMGSEAYVSNYGDNTVSVIN